MRRLSKYSGRKRAGCTSPTCTQWRSELSKDDALYPQDMYVAIFWANLGWYSNYIEMMEQQLAVAEGRARKTLAKHWKAAGLIIDFTMFDPDHQARYFQEYPKNLRYSFVVLFCSFVEQA